MHKMGNRFTKKPFFTRDDKTTTIAFPAPRIDAFKAAAEREGISFNRWCFAACEEYLKGSRERAKTRKAEEK